MMTSQNTEFEATNFTLKMKRNHKSLLVLYENNINEKKEQKVSENFLEEEQKC